MKGFFKNIFSKSNNSKERTSLDILEYAISDAGLWTWWTEEFPDVIQLEFNRTMLYFEPKSPDRSPSNQIAIQFRSPKSVTVLKKQNCSLSNNWLEDFHADKLEPFGIDYENFSFSSKEITAIVQQADVTDTIFGAKLNDEEILKSNVSLAFWAGEIGIVIIADSMKILTHDGEIKPDQITELHNKWWEYWKQYWDVINTDKAMPYDPICEITIPEGKWNMKK